MRFDCAWRLMKERERVVGEMGDSEERKGALGEMGDGNEG